MRLTYLPLRLAPKRGLVARLREEIHPVVSLVAEDDGEVVGHIIFSPVSLSGHPHLKVMGLGPMAVLPEHQRKGIGSALVRAGLEQVKQHGFGAVVLVGHPEFYPRFGFRPASRFDIACEFEMPEEALMAIELQPGVFAEARGTIKYHPAFSEVWRKAQERVGERAPPLRRRLPRRMAEESFLVQSPPYRCICRTPSMPIGCAL